MKPVCGGVGDRSEVERRGDGVRDAPTGLGRKNFRLNLAAKKAGLTPPVIVENPKNQTAPPDASAAPATEASAPNPDGGRFDRVMNGSKQKE